MTREKFEQILSEFKTVKEVPVDDSDVFYKYEDELKQVDSGLFVDRHRWYETSTTVYKCGDWFIGIDEVTNVFPENMSFTDCEVDPNVFEMREVQSVTYEHIKEN